MVRKVDALPAGMPVDAAAAFFGARENAHQCYPIVDPEGRLAGMVSRADALRWQSEDRHPGATLNDAVSDASIPVAHPGDVVGHVADLMISADVGRVPIVDPETGVLVGLVARKDLLRLRSVGGALEHERRAYFGRRMKLAAPPQASAILRAGAKEPTP